jgi:hypothetical protein
MTQLNKKQIKWIEKKICDWYGEKCDDMKGDTKKAWALIDALKKDIAEK